MEIKPYNHPETDWTMEVQFNIDEMVILRAVYREKIHGQIKAGVTDAIDDHHVVLSNSPDTKPFTILTNNMGHKVRELEEFSEHTTEALNDLLYLQGVPPHGNRSIAERITIGKQAKALAERFREEALIYDLEYGEPFIR